MGNSYCLIGNMKSRAPLIATKLVVDTTNEHRANSLCCRMMGCPCPRCLTNCSGTHNSRPHAVHDEAHCGGADDRASSCFRPRPQGYGLPHGQSASRRTRTSKVAPASRQSALGLPVGRARARPGRRGPARRARGTHPPRVWHRAHELLPVGLIPSQGLEATVVWLVCVVLACGLFAWAMR